MSHNPTGSRREGFSWYARQEKLAPWGIAACPDHGRELERYRFRYVGPLLLTDPGQQPLHAEFCAVCISPETKFDETERCTCETAPSRCPMHRD